jgi:hypothetical protein
MAVSKTAKASLGLIKTQEVKPLECIARWTTDENVRRDLVHHARRAGKPLSEVDFSIARKVVCWDRARGKRVTEGRNMADVGRKLSRSGYTLLNAA